MKTLYDELGPTIGERARVRGYITLEDFREARADSAGKPTSPVTTPEIQRLESQLAKQKLHAELTARAKPGELTEVVETDDAGRRIRRFYGDPAVTWEPFKIESRLVTGWKR